MLKKKLQEIEAYNIFVGDPIDQKHMVSINFDNALTRLSFGNTKLVFFGDELEAANMEVARSEMSPGADCTIEP